MTATASPRQIKLLSDLQSYLRSDITTKDTSIAKKIQARLWRIAQGAASAAAENAEEIEDFLVTRPWLTIALGETRDEILARLVALRAEIAYLTPEQVAALDGRTISRHIDAAKALQR